MQLEAVEREVLKHLKEVTNPLVPLSTLFAHLESNGTLADMDRSKLEPFLRDHELFRVMDPPGLAADPEARAAFAELGLPVEPYVLLDTRVPGPRDVTAALILQMDGMATALTTAAKEASEKQKEQRLQKIEAMLKRVQAVREKLIAMA